MRSLFLTLTLVAVALAGCSDDPASGDFTSTGSALLVDGHVHESEFVAFDDPTAQAADPANQQCLADGAPPEADPLVGQYRCTDASTMLNYNIMGLSSPGAGTLTMAFADSSGTNPVGEASPVTDDGDGTYSWNYTSDANEKDMFDSVVLMLNGETIATSGIEAGNALEVVDHLVGITFEGSFTGKDLTLTVSGIGEENPFMFTAWLVTVDEAGAKTHAESFSVVDGENLFEAVESVDGYQEVHIHVTGTQMNVAIGAL